MPTSAHPIDARSRLPVALSIWLRPIAWTVAAVTLAAPLAIVHLVLAAVAFAAVPTAGRSQQAEGEPVVHVCATLTHTDIVLPSHDPLIDWRAVLPAAVPANLPADAGLAFGWGDLRFFQETPTWADLQPSIALGALLGLNTTAIRVVPLRAPAAIDGCLSLKVDRDGRRAIIAFIRASLQLGADGRPILQPGGAEFETFYRAVGRYGPLRTCNQWASEALTAAGLPQPRFAPLSFGVTLPLLRLAAGR